MNNFGKFLTRLSADPFLRISFALDEKTVAAGAKLSERDIAALKTNEPRALYAAAGLDGVQPPKVVQFPQLAY